MSSYLPWLKFFLKLEDASPFEQVAILKSTSNHGRNRENKDQVFGYISFTQVVDLNIYYVDSVLFGTGNGYLFSCSLTSCTNLFVLKLCVIAELRVQASIKEPACSCVSTRRYHSL